MEKNKEYYERILNIIEKGGFLWAIERTDTHKFLAPALNFYRTDRPHFPKEHWNENISFLCFLFFSKEDAEEELKHHILREGGCSTCGHGSIPIPILITEHEFIGK